MKPSMTCGSMLLLSVLFAVFGLLQAVTLEVSERNSTCIKAELSALLTITYNTSSTSRSVQVPLPNTTTVDAASSRCGSVSSSPWLVAAFGSGHALGLNFSTNGSLYNVASLMLQYNLSDSSIFPDANSSAVVTVLSASAGIWAAINTTYHCASAISVVVGGQTVTFSDMRLEAYMPQNDLSSDETICAADQALTTTSVPSTTVRPPITPAPEPTPPGPPQRGNYSISNSNGTACLLAEMGLQLDFSYVSQAQNQTVQEFFNLSPNLTTSSGSCEANNAILVLSQGGTTALNLTFTLNSTASKYYLSGINMIANRSDMTAPFSAGNSSLNYLRTTQGRSYMCNAEQTLAVVPSFSLNTFRLQVQAFGLTNNQFATAEECQMDQDEMLIPIIVGAALAGLVLIVLIAYLIGRKRSHAGYQTI
ncbi:lysosome-associated membrane glycoprotein 1a [Syngnathus typhle]|uniref:lysosome-associated membrane glycoprotein 1a n=1 Tax=Syngnathus typhle TaxID=161592 RepID=UPI002A6B703E|nr:lysosome-associated membrane glycoprotein 1a [Syngnathus typhle]